jgi:hypothetical protein
VCIVMEYANGGSLFDLVRTSKRLKESQVAVAAEHSASPPKRHGCQWPDLPPCRPAGSSSN